ATIAKSFSEFYVGCFNATIQSKTISGTTTQSNYGTSSTLQTATSLSISLATRSTSTDVGVNVSWSFSGGFTSVRMAINNLNTQQWAAIGLSTDEKMGEDHIFVCQHMTDNNVTIKRMINPRGYSRPIDAHLTSGGIFTPQETGLQDGVVICLFTLGNFTESKRRSKRQTNGPVLLQTEQYHPLIAIGALDNTMQKHNARLSQSKLVALNRPEKIIYNLNNADGNRSNLMKAHGCIMIFTWILIVSTGIIIARYFKKVGSNRKLCGEAVWFSVHRILMSCAAILTILAFLFILVYRQGSWIENNRPREYAHSIIGILVISFAFIQPFLALFRCHPEDHYRFIYNYLHAFIGFTAFLLSISAIFLAVLFSMFDFKKNVSLGIMIAWTCWIVLIFFTFECVECCFKNDRKHNREFVIPQFDGYGYVMSTISTPYNPNKERSNPMKNKFKCLLLILHVLVACGLSLALMIIISQS
ncbi:unnamed protein product, partial [Didymodactylos carnosus]